MNKLSVMILFFLFFLPLVSAYYADIVVDVDNAGFISITGITNHENLLVQQSSEFTSKDGRYWLLNISTNGTYSDVVYEINLPTGAIINYMKLPSFGRIQQTNGITISGAQQDVPLSFIIQYELASTSKKFSSWIFELIIFLLVGGLIAYYLLRFSKKKQEVILGLDNLNYSPRQLLILKLLQEHGGVLTQVRLEQLTGFPKSSLSRNIKSLVNKNAVEKFNKGMSNNIRLK